MQRAVTQLRKVAALDQRDAFTESLAIQSAASALGFDWPNAEGVLDKVEEEAGEIRAALAQSDLAQAQRELGDLLLITTNLSRFLEIDPAEALRAATRRFSERFDRMKIELTRQGKAVESCSLEELDEVWNHVKRYAAQ